MTLQATTMKQWQRRIGVDEDGCTNVLIQCSAVWGIFLALQLMCLLYKAIRNHAKPKQGCTCHLLLQQRAGICKKMNVIRSSAFGKWAIIYTCYQPAEGLETGHEALCPEVSAWGASTSGPLSNEQILLTWTVDVSTQCPSGCDWPMDLGVLA